MKNYILFPALLLTTLAVSSCGDDREKDRQDSIRRDSIMRDSIVRVEQSRSPYEKLCTSPSNFALTIKNYDHDMSGKYAFETSDFEVKQSNIEWTNDSNAIITLKNYDANEFSGNRNDNQVDIVIELTARLGNKIGAATYKHNGPELEYSSMTTIVTSKGKVFFNWMIGMDEQGEVRIDYIEGNEACGAFMLAVDKPDNKKIGVVRLNGNFRTK